MTVTPTGTSRPDTDTILQSRGALSAAGWGQRIRRLLHDQPTLGPVLVLALALIVFSAISPTFRTAANAGLILQQVTIIAVLALGQALIILTAGIDLSVGALTVLASIVMGISSAQWEWFGPFALGAGLIAGVVLGAINGGLVTWLRLPPFLVTLGTLAIFGTLVTLSTGGANIRADDMSPLLSWTGTPLQLGGFRVTYAIFIVVALYLIFTYVMRATAWGKHVVAVGDDREAARLSGIRVNRVLLSVYAVSGLVYAIGAWVVIGRVGAASPNSGADYNLDSITAVVIGGISLFGGRGRVWGALIGALIVTVFRNGLQVSGVQVQWQGLAIGALTIIAVALDQRIRTVGSAR